MLFGWGALNDWYTPEPACSNSLDLKNSKEVFLETHTHTHDVYTQTTTLCFWNVCKPSVSLSFTLCVAYLTIYLDFFIKLVVSWFCAILLCFILFGNFIFTLMFECWQQFVPIPSSLRNWYSSVSQSLPPPCEEHYILSTSDSMLQCEELFDCVFVCLSVSWLCDSTVQEWIGRSASF